MYSSFFGLNVGQQGLFTARTALNVTNNNISNIDTEGYSRQYHVQKAMTPMHNGKRGMIGTGAEVTNVERYRDAYLDNKYWGMAKTEGQYKVKEELMAQLEIIMNEPTDAGLAKHYGNIFTALEDLHKNPNDNTSRTSLVKTLNSFAGYVNDLGNKVLDIQKDANFGINNVVNQINHHSKQIALVNQQISNVEVHGNSANSLRDERDRLIDSLSKLVNTKVVKYDDELGKEHFRVSINNQLLVQDNAANFLETRPRHFEDNPEDSFDMLDIYWKGGREFDTYSVNLDGELKGYLDIRDGNNDHNFRGKLAAGTAGTTVVVDGYSDANPLRTDLKNKGELTIGGKTIIYHNAKYNKTSGQTTFDIGFSWNELNADGSPKSMGVEAGNIARMPDIHGEEFEGKVIGTPTADSIQIENTGGQVLNESGEILIGGEYYSYTSISGNGTGTITLHASTPAVTGEVEQGDGMDYKGIPHYINRLNEFVRTIAKTFNDLNMQGRGNQGEPIFVFTDYDENNVNNRFVKRDASTGKWETDANGKFIYSDEAYEKMTCHNFKINPAIIADNSKIEHTKDEKNLPSDNTLTLDFIKIRHDSTIFEKGEPENYIQALIGEAGIDSKTAKQLHAGQKNLLHLVNNRRVSVSGVEINEEVNNLMKYQQAYSLAAKIISVMDEVYDVTINRMGL